MKFTAVLLTLCIALLGACGHQNVAKPESVSSLPAVQKNAPGTSPFPESESLPVESLDAPPISDYENLVSDQAPREIDLLERIRQGFRFPKFQSKHIAEYEKWSSEHSTYLANLLERARPMLHYIVEEIEKRNLPMELALLPAIESAYKPNAVSRSHAAGLWQFVPATGRGYGLRQDWWYDGRRDLIASTDAALDYLTELNALYKNDWFLALAAYNAGQGTVSRAMKRNAKKNRGTGYQDLKLRSETRRYVPKLLALKNIILDPESFGVKLIEIPNHAQFEILDLQGQLDVHSFASDNQIDLPELLHLNAGFLRWATPPEGPFRLLVPNHSVENAKLGLLSHQSSAPISLHPHKVGSGETLSELARRYKVSVAAIKQGNHLSSDRIRAGRTLLIPVSATANRGNSDFSETSTVAHAVQTNDGAKSDQRKLIHQVRRGETLWSIARQYQVQVKELLSWNELEIDHILSLDQSLLVFSQ